MQVIPVVVQQTLWFCIWRFGLSGSCLALQWEVKMSQRKAVYAAKFLRLGWSHGTWVQTCGKHLNLWTSVNLFPQFQGASKSPCRWCFLDAPFMGAKPIQNHYTHFHILHCNTQKTEEGRNMLNIFEYEGMERTFRRNMKETWTNMESWGHRAGPNGSCWGRNPGTSQVSWGTWFPTDRMIQGWEMFRFGCCDSFFLDCFVPSIEIGSWIYSVPFFKRVSVFSYFPIVLPFCNLAGPFENPVRRWVRLREKACCSGTVFRSVSFVFFEELPFSSSSFRSWCVWHLDMLRHVLISFIFAKLFVHFKDLSIFFPNISSKYLSFLFIKWILCLLQARQFSELPPPRRVPVPKPARRPFLKVPWRYQTRKCGRWNNEGSRLGVFLIETNPMNSTISYNLYNYKQELV